MMRIRVRLDGMCGFSREGRVEGPSPAVSHPRVFSSRSVDSSMLCSGWLRDPRHAACGESLRRLMLTSNTAMELPATKESHSWCFKVAETAAAERVNFKICYRPDLRIATACRDLWTSGRIALIWLSSMAVVPGPEEQDPASCNHVYSTDGRSVRSK